MERRSFLEKSGVVIGGLFFSGTVITTFSKCQPDDLDSEYVLSPELKALVNEAADLIIPRTDSPGAKDIDVASRIDLALYNNYEKPDQRNFAIGLEAFDLESKRAFGSKFMKLEVSEQDRVMQIIESTARNHNDPLTKPIFPFLKGMTVIAYFASEEISKHHLLYNAIPGEWKGDVPYTEVNGVWSLPYFNS